MNNLKTTLVAVSACAALASPAVALADHGHGHGHGPDQHGPNQHALDAHGRDHSANPQSPGGASTRGHRHLRNAIFTGTVQSVAGDVVTVTVSGGNHAARAFDGQAVQFDVSSARIVVRDTNGDGKRDVQDVAAGDRVVVQAWLARDGSSTQPFAARRLVDRRPRHTQPKSGD